MTDGMNEEDFQAVLNDEKEYEKLEKAAEDAQIENIMYKWEHVDIATPNQELIRDAKKQLRRRTMVYRDEGSMSAIKISGLP